MFKREKKTETPAQEPKTFVDTNKPDPSERIEDNRVHAKERELDHGLKETFPASDPVSINPGAD